MSDTQSAPDPAESFQPTDIQAESGEVSMTGTHVNSNSIPAKMQLEQTKVPAPVDVVQASPFYTKLNTDVRMAIYDHLYGHLPSLARKCKTHDIPGMVLSCRQANLVSSRKNGSLLNSGLTHSQQELSQAAARHLKLFLEGFSTDFEKKYQHGIRLHDAIPLYDGWKALKSITLAIDTAYFTDNFDHGKRTSVQCGFDAYGPQSSGLSVWDGILLSPFNKVTLIVTNGPGHGVGTDVDEDVNSAFIVDYLRDHLEQMGEAIGAACRNVQDAWDSEVVLEREYGDTPARFYNKYEEYDDTPKRKW
jgi:hypothetical protein